MKKTLFCIESLDIPPIQTLSKHKRKHEGLAVLWIFPQLKTCRNIKESMEAWLYCMFERQRRDSNQVTIATRKCQLAGNE